MAVRALLSIFMVFGVGQSSVIPVEKLSPVPRASANVSSGCINGPDSRGCWNGSFSIDTDAEVTWPNTGRTVYYSLELTNQTLYPDGTARDMLIINGQYPGPVLTASESHISRLLKRTDNILVDWGDWLEIDVTNNVMHNGYASSLFKFSSHR